MSKLDEFAAEKTLQLTTVGRRSGVERTALIWFVVDGDCLLVQAGPKGQKGWYANVGSNPEVRLQVGDLIVAGIAERIQNPTEEERIGQLFRRKYWLARVASWLGLQIGRGRAVRIRLREE